MGQKANELLSENEGEVREGCPRGARKLLGVIHMFILFIVMIISWGSTYAKMYHTLYFEYVWTNYVNFHF